MAKRRKVNNQEAYKPTKKDQEVIAIFDSIMEFKEQYHLWKKQVQAVQPFFTSPTSVDANMVNYLCGDILTAKNFVGVSAAWFTNKKIALAIGLSQAKIKKVLINEGDGVFVFKTVAFEIMTDFSVMYKEIEGVEEFDIYLLKPTSAGGIVHSKFIVTDDIVWTGSYNWTENAKNNYENLVRIKDEKTAAEYSESLLKMIEEQKSWSELCRLMRGLIERAQEAERKELENA